VGLGAAGVAAPGKPRMRTALPWAMAASVVIAILVGTALVLRPTPQAPPVAFATHVGEQRRVALEDGSSVMLNTASEISVKYTAAQRTLTLVKGQATFEVAKDASRPFVVRVGQGTVTALGTVFDVYRQDDRVTVTLLEGSVAVLPKADDSGEAGAASANASGAGAAPGAVTPIVLTAGQQVSYAESDPLPMRVQADVERALAWRRKKMDFRDTLLPEAIAEANRYSNVKIELRAPGLENARMSGVFDTDGKGFIEGVQAYFGLQAEPVGSDRIVLTPEQ
jgi:transmembrane sensor